MNKTKTTTETNKEIDTLKNINVNETAENLHYSPIKYREVGKRVIVIVKDKYNTPETFIKVIEDDSERNKLKELIYKHNSGEFYYKDEITTIFKEGILPPPSSSTETQEVDSIRELEEKKADTTLTIDSAIRLLKENNYDVKPKTTRKPFRGEY